MPNARSDVVRLSWNSGELSPRLDARSDLAKVTQAGRTVQNAVASTYGKAGRRAGLRFMVPAKGYALPRLEVGVDGVVQEPGDTTVFAQTPLGVSVTKVFTITNRGEVTLDLTSVTFSNGDFTLDDALPATLGAYATFTTALRFTPSSQGSSTGTVTVVSAVGSVLLNLAATVKGALLHVEFSIVCNSGLYEATIDAVAVPNAVSEKWDVTWQMVQTLSSGHPACVSAIAGSLILSELDDTGGLWSTTMNPATPASLNGTALSNAAVTAGREHKLKWVSTYGGTPITQEQSVGFWS